MRVRACLIAGILVAQPLSVVIAPAIAPRLSRADEMSAARKNFELAIQREEKGDWAGALVMMRKVAAVKTNHIVRFHLALCLEKTGKLVEALNEFAQAKVQAEKDGGTDAELTIANATKHMAALRARLPSVLVKRPAIVGVAVTIDGESALFDAATPLDPGEHRVEVRAPERKPFRRTVVLSEGATTLTIEPTLDADDAAKPARSADHGTHDVAPAPSPSRSVMPWVLGGIGAVTLVGAGVAYGLRGSALAELDATCDAARTGCDPAKTDLDERGRDYTVVGNVLLGVSAVAIVSAVTWAIVEPSPPSAPTVSLVVGPWTGLRGAF